MERVMVSLAESEQEIADTRDVRRAVFQLEQGIHPELDFDRNEHESFHVIARYMENSRSSPIAVGTMRFRFTRKTRKRAAKIERMAVLKEHRGKGIGKMMLWFAFANATGEGAIQLRANVQVHAQKFYESFGFMPTGETFEEAGITHVPMIYNVAK